MRRKRKAKIVATLGPSSSSYERIRALFEAGADVFRLNFSHGQQAEHKERLGHIRKLEEESGRPIGVLMDLQGPKLRIGRLAGGSIKLEAGQPFRLDLAPEMGDAKRAPLPHPEIFAALEPGADLLLDDGKLRLRVAHCGPTFAECEVAVGGVLSDRKGVNVPGVVLPISSLTEKDRADLQFGIDIGVDWVGLSFVQRPEDIAEARKLIAGRAGVLAKLEKPAAIEHLEEIVELVDAVMVARGDLGVELPPEDVPLPPAPDRPRLPLRRTARGDRDPDARIDDPLAHADARRGLRRGDRGLRGRGRGHALGRDGERGLSGRGGRDDGPHRRTRRARPALPSHHGRRASRPGGNTGRRHHRGGAPGREHGLGGGDRHLHQLGLDHAQGRARAARRADPLPDAQNRDGAPPSTRLGYAIACTPRTCTASRRWSATRATTRSTRASRPRATASSPRRACPSARRGPPTSCASPG